MKNIFFLFSFCLFLSSQHGLLGQPVVFSASVDCVPANDNVCLDITVADFTDIVSFQYSMHFDTSVMSYDTIQIISLPPSLNYSIAYANVGTLTFAWLDQTFSGISLADGTVIYQVCFQTTGTAGQSSTVTFNGSPTPVEVLNSSFSPVPVNFVPGIVAISSNSNNIWTAAGDGVNWSDAGNWCNGTPVVTEDVFINNGTCLLDVPPVMATLNINGGELKKINPATSYATNASVIVGPSGILNIDSGTFELNGPFENNGILKGNGTLDTEDATVTGYGTVAPGSSAGKLKVKGTYCNELVELEIGFQSIVKHDLLEITQTVVAEGILEIQYLGGTVPPGIRTLIECPTPGCMTGMFNEIHLPPQCPAGGCQVILTDQAVKLENTLPIEYTGTCTWLGGTGNWSDQHKWSCNDIPNANDTVVMYSGEITLVTPVTVGSVIVYGGSIHGTDTLTVNGPFKKNGPANFTMNTPFYLPATGLLTAASGMLDFNNLFIYGGGVQGNGTIDLSDATVSALSDGNFSPGASPGSLVVSGDYTNHILNMEILETSGLISKDLLTVTGSIDLSGSTLNILPSGTVPLGTFQMLTFNSNPGNTQFSSVNIPYCGNCSLLYGPNDITLINTQACLSNLSLENITLMTGTYRSAGELILSNILVNSGNNVNTVSDTGVLFLQNVWIAPGATLEMGIEICP